MALAAMILIMDSYDFDHIHTSLRLLQEKLTVTSEGRLA